MNLKNKLKKEISIEKKKNGEGLRPPVLWNQFNNKKMKDLFNYHHNNQSLF